MEDDKQIEDPDLGMNITSTMLAFDELYGDHIHQNSGSHIHGGIVDDSVWQCRW